MKSSKDITMTARLPSVVDLGANVEPQVNVIRHDPFFHLEILANKIDGAPDAAQTVTSVTLVAKAESIPQPALWIVTVKKSCVQADQNHALAIVVQQMKSREQDATHWYGELQKSQDRLILIIRDNSM